jgi:hypothetical protein
MPPNGFHHFIECHLTKLFSIVVFASTGFYSYIVSLIIVDGVKVKRSIKLRLFMVPAQDLA